MSAAAGEPPVSGLQARIRVRRPGFELDAELRVEPGRAMALLGPNGAGKTTALRVLAGLTPATAARVVLDGAVLDDTATGRHTPADRRPVGFVFQDYLLFPHLSALDNVAFGPRCQGRGRREARTMAAAWLDRVGLGAHAQARPRTLSGGQAQRVALARALVCEPRLLLLDEPLAALDAGTRVDVRAELRHHLTEFTGATLIVTHDPLDAMTLADLLVVVENGRVVQQGTPGQVARRPRTDYVARLVGLNLYRARADGHALTLPDGIRLSTVEEAHGDVFVAFPPSAIALYRQRPDGTPRNLWLARIGRIDPHGHTLRVHLDGPVPAAADVTPAAVADLGLAVGQQVWAAVKATETSVYPA